MRIVNIGAILTAIILMTLGCESHAPAPEKKAAEAKAPRTKASIIADEMSLEEKIRQMFFVDSTGLAELGEKNVGGIILFEKDMENKNQLTQYIADLKDGFEIPVFVGVDEEGGTVSRVGKKGITEHLPAMKAVGDGQNPQRAAEIGQRLAKALTPLGFNVDFAPCTDTLSNPENKEIGSRAFSSDSLVVGEMAAAQIEAMQENSLSACAKHFPGHGSTTSDSHKGTAVSNLTLSELREGDLKAFEKALYADFIMVSHMSLPNVNQSDVPCSLSENIITKILKDEMEYEGIVITDALNMGAVSNRFSAGEAAVMAVEAGADMLLMPENVTEAYNAVLSAVQNGEISEERINESVLRILNIKIKRGLI